MLDPEGGVVTAAVATAAAAVADTMPAWSPQQHYKVDEAGAAGGFTTQQEAGKVGGVVPGWGRSSSRRELEPEPEPQQPDSSGGWTAGGVSPRIEEELDPGLRQRCAAARIQEEFRKHRLLDRRLLTDGAAMLAAAEQVGETAGSEAVVHGDGGVGWWLEGIEAISLDLAAGADARPTTPPLLGDRNGRSTTHARSLARTHA
jgi:hypothetical protein